VRRAPTMFTARFAKRGRERRILVDYLRNNRTNTSIAAYSTRAQPEAPVSMPIAWSISRRRSHRSDSRLRRCRDGLCGHVKIRGRRTGKRSSGSPRAPFGRSKPC